jgi:hypothetical protein
MRDRNDINELFRRNQYKLRQRPDPRVWRRLEQRLDAPPRQRFGRMISRWSMAAAILLLVGISFVLMQVLDGPGRTQANATPQPTEIEDLNFPVGAAALSYERNLQLRYEYERSTPIIEGEGEDRLVLSNHAAKPTSGILAPPGPRG